MARYPTFEDYQKRGNYDDGIKRCDDLLKKSPNDVQLLTVKLQLVYATKGDGGPILDQLLSIQPPILDLKDLVEIEDAVISSQSDDFPQPKTAGPSVLKLWENAFKASGSMNHKLDLLSLRFSRGVINNRLADAQQALIQLKALQPRNRVVYMAHMAVTQLLSNSKDDLQSRLGLSLARKAVNEKFDDDSSLDCRVPGQIFALQSSAKDLESIANRSFKESKYVYDALRKTSQSQVNGASTDEQVKDPASVPSREWMQSEVQGLKEQFAKMTNSSAPSDTIITFATNAIRLFSTATRAFTSDRSRAKVDACFLAISGLVKAFEQTGDSPLLLHAAYLAKTLLRQDHHIHEARMILVYLYMRLGLGSLALRMFDSLRVKEIQHDTVGHTLYTRLSLTHPYGTALTKKESIDPFKRTSQALTVYTRCEEKLAENEASVLSHGQTGMIFDLQELRDSLQSSLSRRITCLEQRRLDRLVHGGSGEDAAAMGPKVTANWLEVTDNRDFGATFDYGCNVEKVLHGYNGVVPGKVWILYALAADSAWCLANGFPAAVNDPEIIISELEKAHLDIGGPHINDDTIPAFGLSNAEYLAGDLACQVLKMLTNLTTRPAELSNDISRVQKVFSKLNVEALLEATDMFSKHLVDCCVYLDVLKIVAKACSFAMKRPPEHAQGLQKLQTLATEQSSALQTHAEEQSKKIKAADIKTLMKQQDDVCEAATALGGEDDLELFCESVEASAKEGWEGVMKPKLV